MEDIMDAVDNNTDLEIDTDVERNEFTDDLYGDSVEEEKDPQQAQKDQLGNLAGITDDTDKNIPSETELMLGKDDTDKLNNYYWCPDGGKVEYENDWDLFGVVDPTLEAKETKEKVFSHWYVIKYDNKSGEVVNKYESTSAKIVLTGSDADPDEAALYYYEVYAIYLDK